jgi:predicted transcriptional regulator
MIKLENFNKISLSGISRISGNTFSTLGTIFSSLRYGFDIKGSGSWIIDDNTFTNFSLRESGFKLEQSDKNQFFSNHVYGGGYFAGADNSTGYFLNSSIGNLFCCNSASDTRYGHRFMMICDDTKMRHSDMSNHQYSVHCSGGYFGQQYDEGNLFNTTSGTAFHGGSSSEIVFSQFKVFNLQTPHYPEVVNAPNQNLLNPWFILNGNKPTCNDENTTIGQVCFPPEEIQPSIPRFITDSDKNIAEKGFESENPVLQWEGERNLYADLKAHPDLLGTDHLIDSFYNREQSGAINAVYEVEQALAKVRTVPSSYNAALISIRDSIDAKTTQINQRLTSLSTALTANDSANLYLQANRLLAERSVFSRNLISLQEQMKTERLLHINTSLAVVNSLEANNVYKQNFKTVSRIYLETIGQDNMTLSPNQFSTISAIAHQCILEGGTAVLEARRLYQLHEVKYFSDDTLCQSADQRKQSFITNSEIKDLNIQLIPNPANEVVMIRGLIFSPNEIGTIELFDLNGRLVETVLISGDQPMFNSGQIANGVYACRITKTGMKVQSLKLVIIH